MPCKLKILFTCSVLCTAWLWNKYFLSPFSKELSPLSQQCPSGPTMSLLLWKRLTSIHEHREFVHFQRQLENRRGNRVSRVQTNLSVNTCQSGWTTRGTGLLDVAAGMLGLSMLNKLMVQHGASEVTGKFQKDFKLFQR